ncbi:MAG: methyltransferase domain-containing protein [Hyphomicrobiaceae bacterium]|nr:MAG: methyltransferase domain-containing protein [Hyphomicrobiaceae bacterium]
MPPTPRLSDTWAAGDRYEPYVGRWSRLVAREFLAWLAIPAGKRWLDVGCGTGALSQTILDGGQPAEVVGVDLSEGFLGFARMRAPQAQFRAGDAQALPFEDNRFDAAVSGLVINFVPDPSKAAAEMCRVVGMGGTAAAYVWDYAGDMQLMRHFWDAAVALDPAARALDEGPRFPLCHPDALLALWSSAGLEQPRVRAIDVPTVFKDFDDYWSPFLGGQGPAPTYCMSLTEDRREQLRRRLMDALPIEADGRIALRARAFAVCGRKQG